MIDFRFDAAKVIQRKIPSKKSDNNLSIFFKTKPKIGVNLPDLLLN
jgi:hypothetical protein